jgi:CRP/FNR family cyclic AMP-dependent transcriptional regulator
MIPARGYPFMPRQRAVLFNPETFLGIVGSGKTILKAKKNQILFSQGDASDAVFYVQQGKVKLTVVSSKGKEAIIAVLEPTNFFGEGCRSGSCFAWRPQSPWKVPRSLRIEKSAMTRVLHEEPAFSELFMAYLLGRNIRIEEDLVDHIFHSSEKRLARILLLLADMVGTTRLRVSSFMNKFRELGFIEYNGELKIHSSLLNIVLHD